MAHINGELKSLLLDGTLLTSLTIAILKDRGLQQLTLDLDDDSQLLSSIGFTDHDLIIVKDMKRQIASPSTTTVMASPTTTALPTVPAEVLAPLPAAPLPPSLPTSTSSSVGGSGASAESSVLPVAPSLDSKAASSYPRYIYLIRHGEKANAFTAPDASSWKKAHRGLHRFDPPLTAVGREQAQDTATRLAAPTFAMLAPSPPTSMKPLPSMLRQPSQLELERIEAAANVFGSLSSPSSRASFAFGSSTSTGSRDVVGVGRASISVIPHTHSAATTTASSWQGTGAIDEKTNDAIVSTQVSDVRTEKEMKRLRVKEEANRKKLLSKTLKYEKRNAKRAAKVAKEGSEHQIHHIYSSPFTRCVETAAPLAAMLNLPIRLEWGFSENLERGSIGDNEVPIIPSASEHRTRFPLVDDKYVSLFAREHLRRGGEERPDVVRRTKFALERILANTTGNIAIFTHGGPVEKVTSSLVIDKTFEPSFCGVSRIRMDAPRAYFLELQCSSMHVQQKYSLCRKVCICRPKCSRYPVTDDAIINAAAIASSTTSRASISYVASPTPPPSARASIAFTASPSLPPSSFSASTPPPSASPNGHSGTTTSSTSASPISVM